MKDIEFINKDVNQGFVTTDGVDQAEKIRNCDHNLEISSGFPRNILGCSKCGWWTFVSSVPAHMMEKYLITDRRD